MPLNQLSLVTAPIEIFAENGFSIGKATSFFYKVDEDFVYLVNNWHVVTGRDGSNPRHSKLGAVPTKATLILHKKVGSKSLSLSHKLKMEINLNDALGEDPQWIEHHTFRHRADVVIFKLDNDDDFKSHITYAHICGIERLKPAYEPEVTDDVFVIGYPWGLTGGDKALPLFKRGSVASEPSIDFGELPRFLIDCRTSESMSGSPVIHSHSGVWNPNGMLSHNSIIGTVEGFGGVYSGRLKTSDVDKDNVSTTEVTEIGIVWKRTIIDEIIANGVDGTRISML